MLLCPIGLIFIVNIASRFNLAFLYHLNKGIVAALNGTGSLPRVLARMNNTVQKIPGKLSGIRLGLTPTLDDKQYARDNHQSTDSLVKAKGFIQDDHRQRDGNHRATGAYH